MYTLKLELWANFKVIWENHNDLLLLFCVLLKHLFSVLPSYQSYQLSGFASGCLIEIFNVECRVFRKE